MRENYLGTVAAFCIMTSYLVHYQVIETSAHHKYHLVLNPIFPVQLGILDKEIAPPPHPKVLKSVDSKSYVSLWNLKDTRAAYIPAHRVAYQDLQFNIHCVWVALISVPLKAYFGNIFKKKFYLDRVDQLSFDIYQRKTLFLLVYYCINFIGNQTKLKRGVSLKWAWFGSG